VRGGSVVYLTVTLIVFAVLLSGTDVDTAIPWVNSVVHQVFPIVVIVDWLVVPPAASISWRRSLVWLGYPLSWTAYTLVRGAIVGWYPYPFLDPTADGYGRVAADVAAIFVFGIVVCSVVATLGSAVGGRRASDTSDRVAG
jgi:hypothetical protein